MYKEDLVPNDLGNGLAKLIKVLLFYCRKQQNLVVSH